MKKNKTYFQIYRANLKGKAKKGAYKSRRYSKAEIESKYELYLSKRQNQGPNISIQQFAEQTAKEQARTDKLYNTYIETYNKKKEQAQKSGVTMSPMLNKNEFTATYNATKNDYEKMIEKGERKTTGAISRDIVDSQVEWATTKKQASLAAQAAKDFDLDVTYNDLRVGGPKADKFWEIVRYRRKMYKDQGMSSTDASLAIGQEFFGSE